MSIILKNTVGPNTYNEFSTIQSALDSRVPTSENPLSILVEPGEYAGFTVSNPYTIIKGSGKHSTVISSGTITISSGVSHVLSNMYIDVATTTTGELTIRECVMSASCTCNLDTTTHANFENIEWEFGTLTLNQGIVLMKNVRGDVQISSEIAKGDLTMIGCQTNNLSIFLVQESPVVEKKTNVSIKDCEINSLYIDTQETLPESSLVMNVINSSFRGNLTINCGKISMKSCFFNDQISVSGTDKTTLTLLRCKLANTLTANSTVDSEVILHSCEIVGRITVNNNVAMNLIDCYQSPSTSSVTYVFQKENDSVKDTRIIGGFYTGDFNIIAGTNSNIYISGSRINGGLCYGNSTIRGCNIVEEQVFSGANNRIIQSVLTKPVAVNADDCTLYLDANHITDPLADKVVGIYNDAINTTIKHKGNTGLGLTGIVNGAATTTVFPVLTTF